LIKEIGDGTLSSFHLASDAVRCALDIQEEAKSQNIPLKVGIHEGEMVFAGADVLGDGVNIASRLQEDAHEGCIHVSASVYRDIRNKSDIRTEFLEEKYFKNVDDLMKVYRVSRKDTGDGFELENSESQLPDKKSIIVLPFNNMSPDPDQEYFSDGLTEEIITDLSHIHDLRVISRNSSMIFKGSKYATKEIARKVNVHYVLEGSVRKAGNNLRITAQLIDGLKDEHIWAEKYTGTLDDVFDIQEKVSRAIVDALEVKLSPKEKKSITVKPIDDFKAYEYYLKARQEIWRFTEDSLENALGFLEKGFGYIGDNELLYAAKGTIYWQYVNSMLKPGKTYNHYLKEADACANKVFELNPNSSAGLTLKGAINQNSGKPTNALQYFQKAVINDPNNQDALMWLGYMYAVSGKEEDGREFLDKAASIDPFNPMIQGSAGWSDFFRGNFSVSKDYWHKSYQMDPENRFYRWIYAYFLAMDNQIEEAYTLLDTIEIDLSKMRPWENLCLFQKYSYRGQKIEALQTMNPELREAARWDDLCSLNIAECYALLHEVPQSIEWLENTIQFGIINYPFLNEYDPLLENIRSDGKFKKLMEGVKRKYEEFEIPNIE
jgi:TolB-like protein/tetratricopeptide (TPR) repeat protein